MFLAILAVTVVMPVIASPALVLAEPTDTLDVTIFPDGHLQIGDRRIDEAQLEALARQLVAAVGDRARARIAADRGVVYARVIAVMDVLHSAGLHQISMLVAPEGS
ncbi:MAG: biopolymer transporter ExbD [Deltaproteobacteria bacterium]|nr:biopolymer transporter ExbD [Deltaproteobacteria bacterium]